MPDNHFVVGLMFRPAPPVKGFYELVLMKKSRPDSQKGKYNAPGGRMEAGEAPIAAIVREFKEETDCTTLQEEWRNYCVLESTTGTVHFFVNLLGKGKDISSMTDELVTWVPLAAIGKPDGPVLIPNLHWLIPLALDADQPESYVVLPAPSALIPK